jgi:hypothetical protein
MGGQLFCKIDANDDGTVEWDEFLDFIVHEAGAKLDASKHQAGCTMEAGAAPLLLCQPKDMVGALMPCPKQRILVSLGLVRREIIFWNLDSYARVGEAIIPSITHIDSHRPFTVTNSVAGRSMAYLPTTLGVVFLCSGTEPMILLYDCRRSCPQPPNSPRPNLCLLTLCPRACHSAPGNPARGAAPARTRTHFLLSRRTGHGARAGSGCSGTCLQARRLPPCTSRGTRR